MTRYLWTGLPAAVLALAGCQNPPMEYEKLPKDLKAVPVSVNPPVPTAKGGMMPAAPPLAPGTLVPAAGMSRPAGNP